MRTPGLRTIFSLGALGLAVLLSLADSADPDLCDTSTFDRTFDVTTDCGGVHAGRLHVLYTGVEYGDISIPGDQLVTVSGDLSNLKNAELGAHCVPEEQATFESLNLHFDHGDGTTQPADCDILLTPQGGSAHCTTVGIAETCVTTLVSVP
jgi:hypothetical protein